LQNRRTHCQAYRSTKTTDKITDRDDDSTLSLGGMRLQTDYRGLKNITIANPKQN
jgi:hypothetical protein